MSKTPGEIKLSIPINDSGAGDTSFNFALKVANGFDNIITNNNQHILTDKTLIVTYQNHVLNNANYSTYWEYALNNNKDIKNANGTYQTNDFHKICNSFFNYVASSGCPISAGYCLLH